MKSFSGEDNSLKERKSFPQPGQFASNERVTEVGPKKEIANVSILGPCRKLNQVELSATDARSIGLNAPIRESGDTKGSAPCTLIGPKGQVELEEGVIVAKRHIHMTDKEAVEFGGKNGDRVSVLIENENGRKTIYGDTVIRVSPSYSLAMHIDTDESNAASCAKVQMGKIVD